MKAIFKYRLYWEVVILCAVILLVWSLLSLPIIFYHLPNKDIKTSMETDVQMNVTDNNSVCSRTLQYDSSNEVCSVELYEALAASNCLEDIGEPILVLNNAINTAGQLFSGLDLLGASDICKTEVIPFLCIHLFGLCSSSSVNIQPTKSQCEQIRESTCQNEWERALQIGIDLPDCGLFPLETTQCQNMSNSFINASDIHQRNINRSNSIVLECSEGFYRENGSRICIPSCHSFQQYSNSITVLIDVIVIVTAFIGFIAAITAITISFLRYKRMFTFPSVFIFYMVIDAAILGFFVLISYSNRSNLYCSSINLIESLEVVTPFCVISGVILTYILLQLALWWLFHTISFFWMVHFPFNARSFEASNKVKYIHLICVVLGITFPIVPVVTLMGKFASDIENSANNVTFLSGGAGFRNTRFPPILCTGSHSDAVFYSLVLELDLIIAFGCTLLIIILWSVLRHNVKSKVHHQSKGFHFGTAEKKLLVVLCYYVILATESLTAFTLSTRNAPRILEEVEKYFFCEQGGRDPNNLCSRSEIERLTTPSLSTLSYVLLGLLPLVNLFFIANIHEIKVIMQKWCSIKKSSYKSSTAITTQNESTKF